MRVFGQRMTSSNPRVPVWFPALLALGAVCLPAKSGAQRHALVIGNGDYSHARKLSNATHDSSDVAAALRRAGWTVDLTENAGAKAMHGALRKFCTKAARSDAALFYYAGHGIEVKGRNYLGSEGLENRVGGKWPSAYAYDDGAEFTARVASYEANRFGFYDLGGNVWEMCTDVYRVELNEPDVRAWIKERGLDDLDLSILRVQRGGSYHFYHEMRLRSSYRLLGRPDRPFTNRGFRCVVSAGS